MPVDTSIARIRGKAKIKVIEKRKLTQRMIRELHAESLDTRVSLIQALIPLGLKAVEEELQKEVAMLLNNPNERNTTWGKNPGSVYLQDQKAPILVPRVRERYLRKEQTLKSYQKLQRPYLCDNKTMLKLLNGISTHKYRESAELVPEVFGISASNVSKRFKYVTQEKLRQLKTRDLSGYDIVCIFIDGKRYAEDGLLIVLGVTIGGDKVVLDIDQVHTENSIVINQMLDRLIERGLRYKEGILFIVDGSKGIIKAIKERFGIYGFIQRCLFHKEENVISYLNKFHRELFKRNMRLAYRKTSYKEAYLSLERIYNELLIINETSANSLMEGIEETLTLHRLGLSPELYKSLNTTNCIESVMAQLGIYTDKVDRWQSSNQLLRWSAAGLLEIEPNLKKIRGFRYLPLLRFKMNEEIKALQEKESLVMI